MKTKYCEVCGFNHEPTFDCEHLSSGTERNGAAQPCPPSAPGSASVEGIFREVALMTPTPPKDEDPYESEEYQRFVESMVPHCHCSERNRPCDGVLAGGLCDGINDESDDQKWSEEDD